MASGSESDLSQSGAPSLNSVFIVATEEGCIAPEGRKHMSLVCGTLRQSGPTWKAFVVFELRKQQPVNHMLYMPLAQMGNWECAR